METLLVNLVVGVVVAVISAYLTVLLAMRRFRTQQWWVRKVDAYMAMLDALHHAKGVTAMRLSEIEEHREYRNEHREQMQKKGSVAFGEIQKAVDTGSFLLSNKANEILKKLIRALREPHNADDYYDHLGASFAAIEACLKELPVAARKDLGMK